MKLEELSSRLALEEQKRDAERMQRDAERVLTYGLLVTSSRSKRELGSVFRAFGACGTIQHVSIGGGHLSLADRVNAALNYDEPTNLATQANITHGVLVKLQGTLETLSRCQRWMVQNDVRFEQLYSPDIAATRHTRLHILESDAWIGSIGSGQNGEEVRTVTDRFSDGGSDVAAQIDRWATEIGDQRPYLVQVFDAARAGARIASGHVGDRFENRNHQHALKKKKWRGVITGSNKRLKTKLLK